MNIEPVHAHVRFRKRKRDRAIRKAIFSLGFGLIAGIFLFSLAACVSAACPPNLSPMFSRIQKDRIVSCINNYLEDFSDVCAEVNTEDKLAIAKCVSETSIYCVEREYDLNR